MLLWRLCSTFTSNIKWNQANHVRYIDYGSRIFLNSSYTRDKIRKPNPRKLQQIKLQNALQVCNYIIHRNRIFPYFENKVKNLNNTMIMMMMMIIKIIIIIIIITIRRRRKVITQKMNENKRYIPFSFI